MSDSRTCPACGSADFADLFHAADHLVTGRQYLIRKCNACGMGWTVNPPAESDAGSYYVSEDYISHTDRKQSISDYLYHIARSFMLGRKKRLVASVTGKSTGLLVDIGSGTGYFASYMKEKGWQVSAIEISEPARQYSLARFGLVALTPGDIKSLTSGSADCMTFWHVLEHLYDPSDWMAEAARILSDSGKCIIALPNFSSADAEWFGLRWAALDVPRHLWHFTPEAFRSFAGSNGFVCEQVTPLPLDLFYISILSYRNQGSSLALIRGLLTGAFLAVRNLLSREKSSSLVFVLSKRARGN